MKTNTTNNILDIIFKNANINSLDIKKDNFYIRKLLRYYHEDIPCTPRHLYDGDAVWFYNYDEHIKNIKNESLRKDLAKRGDIMVSFWAPFTYYLGLNKGKIIPKNDTNINILEDILNGKHSNNLSSKMKSICKLMSYFSENYITRGNLLRLPDTFNSNKKRNFNPDKFSVAEDKIDQVLWHCFKNGKLFEYFKSEDNLIQWIKSEHLECLFAKDFFDHSIDDILAGKVKITNAKINQKNITPLIERTDIKTYKYSDKNFDWIMYFDRLNKVVAYRNACNIASRDRFSWELK